MNYFLVTINVVEGTDMSAFCVVRTDDMPKRDEVDRMAVEYAQYFISIDDLYEGDFVFNDGMHIITITPSLVVQITEEEAKRFLVLTRCPYFTEGIPADQELVDRYIEESYL